MKTLLKLSTLALVLSVSFLSAAPSVAPKFASAKAAAAWVAAEVKKDPAAAAEIAAVAAASSPQFAGEITKAAIIAANASDLGASRIVGAVGKAAPEQLDTAASFAVAVRPEAANEVNAVRATLSPSSSPLEFPGSGGNSGSAGKSQVNPTTPPGGSSVTGSFFNQNQPPVVNPNPATNNNRPN
jgi:hypothetical protein